MKKKQYTLKVALIALIAITSSYSYADCPTIADMQKSTANNTLTIDGIPWHVEIDLKKVNTDAIFTGAYGFKNAQSEEFHQMRCNYKTKSNGTSFSLLGIDSFSTKSIQYHIDIPSVKWIEGSMQYARSGSVEYECTAAYERPDECPFDIVRPKT
jgi:hypothetical protein